MNQYAMQDTIDHLSQAGDYTRNDHSLEYASAIAAHADAMVAFLECGDDHRRGAITTQAFLDAKASYDDATVVYLAHLAAEKNREQA